MRASILVVSVVGAVLLAAIRVEVSVAADPADAGQILSFKDCSETWKVASGDRNYLSPQQAKRYVKDFRLLDTDEDELISIAEFRAGCEKGFVMRRRR